MMRHGVGRPWSRSGRAAVCGAWEWGMWGVACWARSGRAAVRGRRAVWDVACGEWDKRSRRCGRWDAS